MDDSPFNSSYFWSPVPTVQGQVDKLVVGIVLKYTWYKWYVLCQKIPRREYHFDYEWKFLNLKEKKKKRKNNNDLTLNTLLITPSDNPHSVCDSTSLKLPDLKVAPVHSMT